MHEYLSIDTPHKDEDAQDTRILYKCDYVFAYDAEAIIELYEIVNTTQLQLFS